ncbi:hypothetical protein Ndes2526B_g02084 [Nannochloris sp. 'desiccata']
MTTLHRPIASNKVMPLTSGGQLGNRSKSLYPRSKHVCKKNRSLCVTSVAMTITPALVVPVLPSLLGGLSLGVLAVTKLVVSGRILGISGMIKGLVHGDRSPWNLVFLSGLLLGGLFLQASCPSVFEALPASATPVRMIGAGLLVGLGTALGNGCTSGHGICGNARFSPRSFVSTLTFMSCGAIATASMQTATLFGIAPGLVPMPAPAADILQLSKMTLAASVVLLTVVSLAARALIKRQSYGECSIEDSPSAPWLSRFTDFAAGFLFALSLGVAGMTKSSKVTGFLAVLSGTFDPSLIFVMGGALLVATPAFQLITRYGVLQKPLCTDDYFLPKAKAIDRKLLIGAALFGAGWGAAGICPGPGVVALATGKNEIFMFISALLAGMFIAKQADAMLEPADTITA